jgi:hypothetical protein
MKNNHYQHLFRGIVSVSFALVCSADTVSLSHNGRTVLEYQQTPNPNKGYVSKLYSPSGAQVLLDSPPDHVHHHGLMLGLDADGVSFWLDGAKTGTQRPRGAPKVRRDSLAHTLEWVTPEGRVLLVEERRITVHPVTDNTCTLITWHSRLTPAKGVNQVSLFTKLHYSGLGLRLPKSMDGKAIFTFINSGESVPVRNSEKVTPADGAACTGPLDDGSSVTVAMFACPGADDQTHWFTMSDSLTFISATKNLYRRPEVLRAGRTLEFTHGIAVRDGAADPGSLAETAAAWTKLVDPPASDPLRKGRVNIATPALGATAYASSVYGEGYAAAKAIDGRWAVRETDKWNSAANLIPHYLTVDLGQVRTIDAIRIVHEGLLPGGQPCTTSDFRLQGSFRRWGPFTDLTAPVRGNADAISEHLFKPRKVRFVRLLIETGEQSDRNEFGRIFEIEVYSPEKR